MKIDPPSLNSVCLLIEDCLHATAPITDEGFPLIRTPNIGKGRLELNGVQRVTEETYVEWTRRGIPVDGDLILAREAPAGNVAIVKNGERVCLGQRTVLIRTDPEKVDPDFLCYYLLAPESQGFLLSNATGVTAPHVNMKDIRRLPLKGLPCLEKQIRIGGLLSAYDNLIENNRRRIALLEETARLLYREWFVRLRFPGHEHTRIANGVPEGWENGRLEDVLFLQRGFDITKKEQIEGPFPVVSSSGTSSFHAEFKVKGPGIVIGRKGSLGTVHLIESDFWPHDTTLWVKEFRKGTTHFCFHLLRELDLGGLDVGAAVPTLNRNHVHCLPVLVPTRGLLLEFESFAESISSQLNTLGQQNQKLRTARDLLLPKLMSGEIEV